MSKEIEAIQVLKANAILFDDGTDYGASMLEAIEVLDKYLTPPTEQEVCEALGEFLNEKVYYEESQYRVFSTGLPATFLNYITEEQDDHTIDFELDLPPHLIIMIGRFYEGKAKEND